MVRHREVETEQLQGLGQCLIGANFNTGGFSGPAELTSSPTWCRRECPGGLGGVFDEQGEDEMRQQPTPGERPLFCREPTETKQALHPLERKFHLPAQAIRLRHLSRPDRGGA